MKLEQICSENFVGGKRSYDQVWPASVPQLFFEYAQSRMKDKLERGIGKVMNAVRKDLQANTRMLILVQTPRTLNGDQRTIVRSWSSME